MLRGGEQGCREAGALTELRRGERARAPGAMKGERKGMLSVAGLLLKLSRMLPARSAPYRAEMSRCSRDPREWPTPNTGSLPASALKARMAMLKRNWASSASRR